MLPSPVATQLDTAFIRYCLPFGGQPAVLELASPGTAVATLCEQLKSRHGSAESLAAWTSRGLDFVALRSWLGARQRGRQGVVVLAALPALTAVVERLEKMDLRFRLPAGTVVAAFSTSWAEAETLSRGEIWERIHARLGVAAGQVVSAYLPPQLEIPAFTNGLAGGDKAVFLAPEGHEFQLEDPAESVSRVVVVPPDGVPRPTTDLGRLEAGGLRLLGMS